MVHEPFEAYGDETSRRRHRQRQRPATRIWIVEAPHLSPCMRLHRGQLSVASIQTGSSVTRPIWASGAASATNQGVFRIDTEPISTLRTGGRLRSLLARFDEATLVGEDDCLHPVT